MSNERVTTYVWTCDACGWVENLSGDECPPSPRGWCAVVHGSLTSKLGDLPSKHLCAVCAETLGLLLAGRLGDMGDLRQAVADAIPGLVDAVLKEASGYRIDRAILTVGMTKYVEANS